MVCDPLPAAVKNGALLQVAHPYRSPLQHPSTFENYLNAALIALVIHEHIITLDMEVRLIWRKRRTLPAVLFIINRYNLLLDAIVLLQIYLHINLTVINDVSITVAYCVAAALLAWRMYALHDRSRKLFYLILVPSLVPAVAAAICAVSARKSGWLARLFKGSQSQDCHVELSMSADLHLTRK
ncbi:hypothetical protein PsYK624_099700 [Phanerochaete sordida]|uniref:DUF6533 domain-containing protein n=1 Tax=Phanerochaete sordida TaxID=48140 RepID=A0A9P3LGI3_9APHY|nr:hypothetical protein PsYK624_099700 [Phanerochaete sordida]